MRSGGTSAAVCSSNTKNLSELYFDFASILCSGTGRIFEGRGHSMKGVRQTPKKRVKVENFLETLRALAPQSDPQIRA